MTVLWEEVAAAVAWRARADDKYIGPVSEAGFDTEIMKSSLYIGPLYAPLTGLIVRGDGQNPKYQGACRL
jgi:hypothetical protein